MLFENLPTTGQVTGDTYNILNNFTLGGEDYLTGTNVAWNGSGWDALGSHIPNGDEVEYSSGVSVNDELDSKVDKVLTAYDTLTSESVVGTEFVYVDAGGTAKKMTLTELFEATNSSAGAFVPSGVYDDLTVGYAKKERRWC